VPKEITAEILEKAYKIVDNEDHILHQLDSGISFLDILGIR
jgi:regulator of RNase E activity RraA